MISLAVCFTTKSAGQKGGNRAYRESRLLVKGIKIGWLYHSSCNFYIMNPFVSIEFILYLPYRVLFATQNKEGLLQ